MKFFVAVTDNKWFEFLAARNPDEVNFWRPSGKGFRAIEVGAPFLFKLHSPMNFIAGGGYFVRHSNLPLSLAWMAFAEKNGASTESEFLRMVNRLRKDPNHDPEIGCTILAQPFFLPREHWIPTPSDWSTNIVQGKTYDSSEQIGIDLWAQVRERIGVNQAVTAAEEFEQYGSEILIRTRLGQGTFRVLVTEAYGRACSITGERTLPVLEAAHIKPFAEKGPNLVSNGLLLRSDMHTLFDRGYLSVTPEQLIVVSKSIKERFKNGKNYYRFHGERLVNIPQVMHELPERSFLEWHNENVFIG